MTELFSKPERFGGAILVGLCMGAGKDEEFRTVAGGLPIAPIAPKLASAKLLGRRVKLVSASATNSSRPADPELAPRPLNALKALTGGSRDPCGVVMRA